MKNYHLLLVTEYSADIIAKILHRLKAEVFGGRKEANNPRELIGQLVANFQKLAIWYRCTKDRNQESTFDKCEGVEVRSLPRIVHLRLKGGQPLASRWSRPPSW